MDFMRALTFSFDDEDWLVKYIVGSLISLVGFFLPFILLGYQVNVAKRVIRERKTLLPGSDNVGEIVADGIMALLGGLIYWIPGIPFICLMLFVGGVIGDSGLGGMLFLCLTLCSTGFLLIYGIVATALFWMGVIRYAQTGNFNEFLRIGGLWEDTRANLPTLLGLLIYSLVFSLIMAVVVPISLITCVGPIIATFYMQIVSGHLIGQAGLEITQKRKWG